MLFLTQENKVHNFISFLHVYIDKLTVCANSSEKAGNYVIDIFTSEDTVWKIPHSGPGCSCIFPVELPVTL